MRSGYVNNFPGNQALAERLKLTTLVDYNAFF